MHHRMIMVLIGALVVSGAVVPTKTASAATALDATSWVNNDDCYISSFQFLSDHSGGVTVYYSDNGYSDADWSLSGDKLKIYKFRNFPTDTFTGKFDGVMITATHTWMVESVSYTETCPFEKIY